MIALQERLDLARELRQFLGLVLGPAQALASDRAIEALNKALLVLLVWPCDPVLTAELRHRAGKLRLKLRAAVGLDGLHKAVEPAREREPQERFPVCRFEAGTEQNIGFAAKALLGCGCLRR